VTRRAEYGYSRNMFIEGDGSHASWNWAFARNKSA
jgi:hypothetical protein